MGNLCHRTTSYFEGLDEIINSMEDTGTVIVNGEWLRPDFKVDKGGFVEYYGGNNIIIPSEDSQGKGVYTNFDKTLGRTIKTFVSGLTALCFTACAATTNPSYLRDNPDVLNKIYTTKDIADIEKNFKANPLEYSQELGDALLWQMHQKSPELTEEMGKIPEIVDGISPIEVKALDSIIKLVKPVELPPDLYTERDIDKGIHKIALRFHNNSNDDREWTGRFHKMSSSLGSIIKATPIDFEQGDQIDNNYLEKYSNLVWSTKLSPDDTDSIVVTLKYPPDDMITMQINGDVIYLSKKELLKKHTHRFDKNIEGILVVEDMNQLELSSEQYAVRDMVRSGQSKYKFSVPLQALLWGYLDGKFNGDNNPFENYIEAIEFIKPIWGNMKGARWNNFNTVADRLNSPELIHHYIDNNFKYKRGDFPPAYGTFIRKYGNCTALADFGKFMLKKAGYDAFVRTVYTTGKGSASEHSGSGIRLSDDKYLLVVDFGWWGNNKPSGPYDLESLDLQIAHGNKIHGRQWGHAHW